MNLHLARRAAKQKAGSVLADVVVGGWRLSVCPNAEANLWDQWTSHAAMTWNGCALRVDRKVLVRLETPEEEGRN